MKKKNIWTIAIIMGISFLSLLYLQTKYIEDMVKMRRDQFDSAVNRALYQASRNLELNETLRFLEQRVEGDTITSDVSVKSFSKQTQATAPSSMPRALILKPDSSTLSETQKTLEKMVKNRYIYNKALLDEVVYNILYQTSTKPLKERINFRVFDQDIKAELINNGIDLNYHFRVLTPDDREVYRCMDYTDEGEDYSYRAPLFQGDNMQQTGYVEVHFPDMREYILRGVRFMIPSVLFTIIILITFIFTIVTIFRQKRYTEIKNDFVNNMTHELKTPISSISLAAQMLCDESISKSEPMQRHLGKVVFDESKRLRYLVEKVLLMSMFDKHESRLSKKDIDLNQLIEAATSTFELRVEHTGGRIITNLKAEPSTIYADEMHFTNLINNLMDNAVKYKREDVPLEIKVKTWNSEGNVCFSIEDNGIGIKKDSAKKIFEKFYRVHTGNVHNVKGFGLGLAYVKKIVELHNATIHCETQEGHGTKFIVTIGKK